MTRYLLDTNIISEARRPIPSASVVDWLGRQINEALFIATFTLAEIRRGILQRAEGRKRQELEDWYAGPNGPLRLFAGRTLVFGVREAAEWARLMADGHLAGRSRSPIDMILAATAIANGCIVVTANEQRFEGTVALLNPTRPT